MTRLKWILPSVLVLSSIAIADGNDAKDRITDASKVFGEIMAAEDSRVPEWVLERAHCMVIIPSAKQGAFIVGAKYGKGVTLCRREGGGWSAPSATQIEGGSFGFQAGGGEVDYILAIMNAEGKEKLLKNEFTLGAEAGVMAGPIGRAAKAETDAQMRAKILSYSRSRGVFAGIALQGGTLRDDQSDNKAVYGREMTAQEILSGKVPAPAEARELIAQLSKYSWREK